MMNSFETRLIMFCKRVSAVFSRRALGVLSMLACLVGTSQAQEAELNLYSARHYATDEALYADFTRATGIRINRVDSDDAGILSRLKAEDQPLMQRVGIIFPNQSTWGTHMNIAGGAVAQYAKHPDNAKKYLEYLASPSAQAYFANGNNEWPVVKNVPLNNPALQTMGGANFKSDPLPVSFIGMNQIKVQQMLDHVGFR
jgi:ABC-type Fe3+ transport system substrate-binding protein